MPEIKPAVTLIAPDEFDTIRSTYRAARWPSFPTSRVGSEWETLNKFRMKKFAHWVWIDPDNLFEAVEWCEDHFGPQAVGAVSMDAPRVWTRGIWTWLYDATEQEVMLMFIEQGIASLAKIRWG